MLYFLLPKRFRIQHETVQLLYKLAMEMYTNDAQRISLSPEEIATRIKHSVEDVQLQIEGLLADGCVIRLADTTSVAFHIDRPGSRALANDRYLQDGREFMYKKFSWTIGYLALPVSLISTAFAITSQVLVFDLRGRVKQLEDQVHVLQTPEKEAAPVTPNSRTYY